MINVSAISKICAVLLGALLAGTALYLSAKLTVSFLKKYRQKKTSKIFAAKVKDLIKKAPTINLDDLPNMEEDDVILAEYDEENDELVQDTSVAKEIDDQVEAILKDNEGIVIFA